MAERAAVPLLTLTGLTVTYPGAHGAVRAVDGLDLEVRAGECLGVVGESGAGKSQAFLAPLGLLPARASVGGSARFRGRELLGLPAAELTHIRGAGVGLVPQDALSALTPHRTIGAQLAEVRRRHLHESRRSAQLSAARLLEQVHLDEPGRRRGEYPHELSGGMRQRVLIALALAAQPPLLIADEPTTALDVTVQAQILALLLELKRTRALALVLITHDLGAVAGLADRLTVMRAGRALESGPVRALLSAPREPYTRALTRAAAGRGGALTPGAPRAAALQEAGPALAVAGLSVRYPRRELSGAPPPEALAGVDFELADGEALAVVGESGCGKSTLARAALKLIPATAGRIVWLGREVGTLPEGALRAARRELQVVFQDPFASLDPRLRAFELVAEGLRVHAAGLDARELERRVLGALAQVGLEAPLAGRFPHQLSGGQCQRVGLARAMVLNPRVLVCDEPLSALDVSTQEEILELLGTLKVRERLALVFISHDLASVRRLCDRVLVLYGGRTMEVAPVAALFESPRHPYSRELLAAVPSLDPALEPARLAGIRLAEPPAATARGEGCPYRTRCPHALPACAGPVAWEALGTGAGIACRRWRELAVP